MAGNRGGLALEEEDEPPFGTFPREARDLIDEEEPVEQVGEVLGDPG